VSASGTPNHSTARLSPRSRVAIAASAAFFALACAADPTPVGSHTEPIIYGSDDRKEYFDVIEPALRQRTSESIVAFLPKAWLGETGDRLATTLPSLSEVARLCPGEAFGDQPAVAFCSGVLVDTDLVLTAGHCLHFLPLSDFAIVFDYFYASPGELVVEPTDVFEPVEVVAKALSRPGEEERLDYAWVRLSRAALPPRRPAPLHAQPHGVSVGDSIVAIGAGAGLPLKVDGAGKVRDTRDGVEDYFVADTDTLHGASGAAALNSELGVVGILARGGIDWVDTPSGCRAAYREPDPVRAEEQFTYAGRTLEGLCSRETAGLPCSSLCGQPCSPPRALLESGGCAVRGSYGSGFASSRSLPVLLALLWLSRCASRKRGRFKRAGGCAGAASGACAG
jgi:hypothetical protein